MPEKESVLTLDEVYRPLAEKDWFLQAELGIKENYTEAAKLVGPTALACHVLNVFEMGRIPPMKLEKAKLLGSAIDELRSSSDETDSLEVGTRRVVSKKGVIRLALEENDQLVADRRFMLGAVHDIFGLEIPYSGHYSLNIGRVFEPTKEGKIRHFLNDNFVPPKIKLGKVIAKATLNGSQAFLL